MVAAHTTVTFDVHDCAVAPMLTDISGSAPTYGPWIDVPGIAQVGLDPEFVTAELKGDARTLARKGKTSSFTLSATYSVLSLDVMKAIFGGTITDTGTADAESSRYRLLGNNSLPYFKMAFAIQDLSSGLATMHVVLPKSQVTGGSIFDQSTDEFGQRSFQVSGIPTLGEDVLLDVTLFETATNLQTV